MKISQLLFILLLPFLIFGTARANPGTGEVLHHRIWNQILIDNVVSINEGKDTAVNYQGIAKDRGKLKQYLSALSEVTQTSFLSWHPDNQLAFLINAYNAWTVELILTAWPDITSIKELGTLFRSPWKKKWIPLLGSNHSLDNIEHELIRGSDRYNDPRIHFAVNCASISCPALRAEAYIGNRLNDQLNQQTQLFLSNPNHNRTENDVVKISSIFKWYRADFERGWMGYNRLEDFLLDYADELKLTKPLVLKLNSQDSKIVFLKYNWSLNSLTN